MNYFEYMENKLLPSAAVPPFAKVLISVEAIRQAIDANRTGMLVEEGERNE